MQVRRHKMVYSWEEHCGGSFVIGVHNPLLRCFLFQKFMFTGSFCVQARIVSSTIWQANVIQPRRPIILMDTFSE